MGCQNRYGTLAVGVYGSHQPGTVRPMTEQRWSWNYNYEAREIMARADKMKWDSRWSFGCKMTGGGEISGADGAAFVGDSMTQADYYNPPKIQDGSQSLKWLKGLCVDTSDAPLSGVNVQAFRSSDDAFAGYEVQSREDGSYDLATPYVGVNHYVVAYLPGSPDWAGTTLNTLVPTNIDGS